MRLSVIANELGVVEQLYRRRPQMYPVRNISNKALTTFHNTLAYHLSVGAVCTVEFYVGHIHGTVAQCINNRICWEW